MACYGRHILLSFLEGGRKLFKRLSLKRPSICLNSSRHLVSVSLLLEDGTQPRRMNSLELSSQTVRYAAVKIKNTVFISWSEFFCFGVWQQSLSITVVLCCVTVTQGLLNVCYYCCGVCLRECAVIKRALRR